MRNLGPSSILGLSFGTKFTLLTEMFPNFGRKFPTEREGWQKLALSEGFSRNYFLKFPKFLQTPWKILKLPGKFAYGPPKI